MIRDPSANSAHGSVQISPGWPQQSPIPIIPYAIGPMDAWDSTLQDLQEPAASPKSPRMVMTYTHYLSLFYVYIYIYFYIPPYYPLMATVASLDKLCGPNIIDQLIVFGHHLVVFAKSPLW